MDTAALTIRRATERDELAITSLVRSEHLNPIGLDWRRFVIAVDAAGVAGAVQLRRHPDDARELGSLVVRPDARGRGIAARLIDALLATAGARVLMITGAAFAAHYARWGFRRIEPARAPRTVRFNYYFGQFVGGAMSIVAGRRPKRLAILEAERRTAAAATSA
jgi:N-acetylglutamate synthase-like GNAT family acetyltransferase